MYSQDNGSSSSNNYEAYEPQNPMADQVEEDNEGSSSALHIVEPNEEPPPKSPLTKLMEESMHTLENSILKRGYEPFSPNRRTLEEANRLFWLKRRKFYKDISYDGMIAHCKSQPFPVARVKKIMRVDDDIKPLMLGADAIVFMAACTTLFVEELSQIAWFMVNDARRRTVHKDDIATASKVFDHFDFLIDLIPATINPQSLNQNPALVSNKSKPLPAHPPSTIINPVRMHREIGDIYTNYREDSHNGSTAVSEQQSQQEATQYAAETDTSEQTAFHLVPIIQPQVENGQQPLSISAYMNDKGQLLIDGSVPEGTQFSIRPDGVLEVNPGVLSHGGFEVLQPLHNVTHEAETSQVQSSSSGYEEMEQEPLD